MKTPPLATLDLPIHWKALVDTLLAQALPAGAQVFVYGSRANGRARRGSDLDLLIDAGRRLTAQEYHTLMNAFEDSDLSFRVDVADRWALSSDFWSSISKKLLPYPWPGNTT